MSWVKALATAVGIGKSAKKKTLRKSAKRWSGLWTLWLVFDIIRYVRRRKQKVVTRRVLREGDVLVISNTVERKKS